MFGLEINGYENEDQFVEYLNGKKVGEVNPLFRELFDELFKYLKDKDKIIAWKNDKPQKPDIFIKINGRTRAISLKKGIKNSVHSSKISEFIHFLIKNGIKREIVLEYLKFQYADGTTNNTGSVRQSTEEYKIDNQDKMDLINTYFNSEKLLVKAIDKFIIRGNYLTKPIDVLVYGVVNDFIWIKREDIYKILLSKKDIYASGIHFSKLLCQPQARCLNRNPRYENYRCCVQIKWYSLFDDIIEYKNNCIMKE